MRWQGGNDQPVVSREMVKAAFLAGWEARTELGAGAVTLPVVAMVQPGAMHLRTGLARAKGEGWEVEVAAGALNGCVLVTYHPEGEDGWVTYCLTPQALVEAVLAVHPNVYSEGFTDEDLARFPMPPGEGVQP